MAVSLYSIDAEKQYVSALIRNPLLRADTSHLTPVDFSPTHKTIIQVFDVCIAAGGDVNKFVVAGRMDALGIKVGDAMPPLQYLTSLEIIGINDAAAIEVAKEIKRRTVCRELHHTGNEIARMALEPVHSDGEAKTPLEIVSEATESFNRKVNLLGGDEDAPKDAYSISSFLDNETSFENRGIEMPFRLFGDFYGQLDPAGLYALGARLKVGKSTWLMSLLHQIAENDGDDSFRVLILDTELTLDQWQSRLIASITGIKEWFIRRKLYKRDAAMREKVEAAREMVRSMEGKVFHQFVGAMDLAAQISLSRRWYYKHVHGSSRRGMVAVDYFKPTTGSDFGGKTPFFLQSGHRVNEFKNLAIELSIPVYALVQVNREGEDSKGGARMSNSSVIAGGDFLGQLCTTLHLLERLTLEFRAQYGLLGDDAPTHSLKPLATRQLGPNDTGLDGLVKYEEFVHGKPVTRYADNFLTYRFAGLTVSEGPSFREIVERSRILGVKVQTPAADPGRTLEDPPLTSAATQSDSAP